MLLDATTIIYYIYILYIIYTGMTPVNAQSNSIACLTLTTCQVGQVSTTFDHECPLRIPVVPCQTLLASRVGTPWVHMGTHKVNLARVCNVTSDTSEILFELKFRSFVQSLFCNRWIDGFRLSIRVTAPPLDLNALSSGHMSDRLAYRRWPWNGGCWPCGHHRDCSTYRLLIKSGIYIYIHPHIYIYIYVCTSVPGQINQITD